jgi:hypothetical protein
MIPRSGEIYDLNSSAVYWPTTLPTGEDDDATVPTLILGGIRVSAYVDDDGVFVVSVATDEETPSPLIRIGRGEAGAVAMNINVNDTRVFMA